MPLCGIRALAPWVERFFVDGGCPRLALVLEYEEIAGARPSGRGRTVCRITLSSTRCYGA
jgi:hypothetical protein